LPTLVTQKRRVEAFADGGQVIAPDSRHRAQGFGQQELARLAIGLDQSRVGPERERRGGDQEEHQQRHRQATAIAAGPRTDSAARPAYHAAVRHGDDGPQHAEDEQIEQDDERAARRQYFHPTQFHLDVGASSFAGTRHQPVAVELVALARPDRLLGKWNQRWQRGEHQVVWRLGDRRT
jgi:hypothetical protein